MIRVLQQGALAINLSRDLSGDTEAPPFYIWTKPQYVYGADDVLVFDLFHGLGIHVNTTSPP